MLGPFAKFEITLSLRARDERRPLYERAWDATAFFFALGVERPAWVSRHVLTESWAGQLMNGSVIQSIGSLSRQMKAKVLGLRLVDATSSAKMYLRRLATTRVPRTVVCRMLQQNTHCQA